MAQGVAGSMAVPVERLCARCRTRWRQHSDGLCRSCHRADTVPSPTLKALAVVRGFISHQRINAMVGSDKQLRAQAVDALNALDYISERLRESATTDPAVVTRRVGSRS